MSLPKHQTLVKPINKIPISLTSNIEAEANYVPGLYLVILSFESELLAAA